MESCSTITSSLIVGGMLDKAQGLKTKAIVAFTYKHSDVWHFPAELVSGEGSWLCIPLGLPKKHEINSFRNC